MIIIQEFRSQEMLLVSEFLHIALSLFSITMAPKLVVLIIEFFGVRKISCRLDFLSE